MPTERLTDVRVRTAKPPARGRIEIYDSTMPGFGLRISDKGAKSWILMYRFGSRQRRMTIGRYPAYSLADARKRARTALQQVDEGIDPAHERAKTKSSLERTVGQVIDEFVEKYARPRNRSWRQTRRILNHDVKPQWGRRAIATIDRQDVMELIDAKVVSAPVMARLVHSTLRKMFKWAVERGYVESSPVENTQAPPRPRTRDRVLRPMEIAAVWHACDELGYPFGPMHQLLLLTGQRRAEVAGMRWQDIDLEAGMWTLPREATKSDRAHAVPLSDLAVGIIRGLPHQRGPYLFSCTAGDKPVSGFSHAKERIDRLSGVTNWRVHDLRRTAASGMAELGVPPHVVEKVLNHASGTISGVAAVYNRHDYGGEKRQALEAWSARVARLVHVSWHEQAA